MPNKQVELQGISPDPSLPSIAGRYDLVRRLGSGASGIVYEAIDRQSGARLAIKTLRNVEPTTIYRLKNEFRALADVAHPSLVQLHELVSDGTQWFLTMELVSGARDLVSYVRSTVPGWTGPDSATISVDLRIEPGLSPERPPDAAAQRAPVAGPKGSIYADLARVRHSFVQLTRGLSALHDAGILHRDIKPSNVLVDESGRVVIVDFGMAIDTERRLYDSGEAPYAVGTLAYMAPEQARGEPVTTAADWYAVGVMLYEALTAQLPFEGTPFYMMSSKQRSRPRFPGELVDAPDELVSLCTELMDPSPEARPSGEAVLLRLGADHTTDYSMPRSVRLETSPFVGRSDALGVLEAAFACVQSGSPASVIVRGPSGIGKTAFVQKFLASISSAPVDAANGAFPPLILTARCYARESVPFKAFDGIVDELSRFLMQLGEAAASNLAPPDAAALTRMFPVLCRAPAFAAGASEAPDGHDAMQLRQRAFVALAGLLDLLATRSTVVVFIDDIQWSDTDSAALLSEVLRGPTPPPILLIMSHRSENPSPPLSGLLAAVERGVVSRWTVDLAELGEEEAGELALALLGRRTDSSHDLATAIVRESGGSPFFLHQLAQHARASPTVAVLEQVHLETVLAERLHDLPPAALALLNVVAIAGGPIPAEAVCNAAGLVSAQQSRALAVLQTARLVRVSGSTDKPVVEPYHDRIGEAAAAGLSSEALRNVHSSLMRELERTTDADSELLYLHSLGAGFDAKASTYAQKAAESSASKLAFDRAAYFYRRAIDLCPSPSPRVRELWLALGKALVDGGRSAESADAYIAAAEGSSAADQIEFKRRAGEQLLGSGHLDRGKKVMQEALEQAGFRLVPTPFRAVLVVLLLRAWLRLRGLRVKLRAAGDISPSELARLDTCSGVAVAISVIDPLQALLFQSRALLLALALGEPWRLARALTLEASFVSASSGGYPRAMAMLGRARKLCMLVQREDTDALLEAVGGMIHHFNGRWEQALEHYAHARKVYEGSRIASSRWERDNVEHYEITTAIYRGKLRFAMDRQRESLRDAEERGDLNLSTMLQVSEANLVWLFQDDPRTARDRLERALEDWGQREFHSPHWWAMLSRTYLSLYDGEGERALRDFDATWPAAVRSRTPSVVQLGRVTAMYRRGSACLAAAVECRTQPARFSDRIKAAERDGTRVVREKTAYGLGFGLLVLSGVAHLRGDAERTKTTLEEAAKAFASSDNDLWSAVARVRLGQTLGGDRGRDLASSATAWMTSEGVRNPERLAASLAPGFDR